MKRDIVFLALCVLALGALVWLYFDIINAQDKKVARSITIAMEYAYFEGQKDYAEGDIRIKQNGNTWDWSKSPWDGGTKPMFVPSQDVKNQLK